MTETEFNALAAQGYNRIPVSLETFADLDTPLSIYMKLANGPYTYLLESVQGGERFGRYSIIGLAAQTRIVVNGHQVLVLTGNRIAEREDDTNPLDFIGKYMQRFRAPPASGLPRFCGGLVGCFGYDTVRYVETRLTRTHKPDEIGTPDIGLLLSEELAVVDNLSGKLTLIVYAEPGFPGAWQKARARLKELLGKLRTPVTLPAEQPVHSEPAVSTFGEAAFKQAVLKAKRYITEGDIMQVVLSHAADTDVGDRRTAGRALADGCHGLLQDETGDIALGMRGQIDRLATPEQTHTRCKADGQGQRSLAGNSLFSTRTQTLREDDLVITVTHLDPRLLVEDETQLRDSCHRLGGLGCRGIWRRSGSRTFGRSQNLRIQNLLLRRTRRKQRFVGGRRLRRRLCARRSSRCRLRGLLAGHRIKQGLRTAA